MTPRAPHRGPATLDPLYLVATGLTTFEGPHSRTNASGFFFEREGRLYLVTSRHVLFDAPTGHYPDRLEIVVHNHPQDLTRCICWSMPLYTQGVANWRQAEDSGGAIDVAVLEVNRAQLPPHAVYSAFTPEHLNTDYASVPPDASLRIVGFPLGFGDTVYQLPVVRQAAVASPYGIRFQGKGLFLTDARTHRGTSGAPVVMRQTMGSGHPLHWALLGVHSARMDMGNRDREQDESLGLNSTWYAQILMTLTEPH
jgi:hypothetical protein